MNVTRMGFRVHLAVCDPCYVFGYLRAMSFTGWPALCMLPVGRAPSPLWDGV